MKGGTPPGKTINRPSDSGRSLDEERVPSGIKELDRILGGGFPRGTFNCIEGDIGTGTSTFCIQATWSRLSLGGIAVHMCLDEPPEIVTEHFRSFGWNIEPYIKERRLLLVDCHQLLNSLASIPEGQNGLTKRKTVLAEFLSDQRKMVRDVLESHPSVSAPLITTVDSFSSLAPFVDLKSSYVLAHLLANSVRRDNNLFIAVLHTGALEANILCACSAVADGIIRMEYRLARATLRRMMWIEKMAFTPIPSKPLEYAITSKNGIEILLQDTVDEDSLNDRGSASKKTRSGRSTAK